MVHWEVGAARGCLQHDALAGIAEPDLLPRRSVGVEELSLASNGIPAVVAVVGWIVAGGAVGPEILFYTYRIKRTLQLILNIIVSFDIEFRYHLSITP